MFSSVGGDATAMFFIYHVNIFTLFFTILFYRQNKLLVGLPLFFGYCISIIILYLLNNPIQSYVRIFSVLYNLGAGLIFVLCVFLDIKRFKSGYKIMDIQNLFFGFCLGFFIFILSVLLSIALFYGISLLFSSHGAFLHFLILQSLFLGLYLLYFLAQNVYMLWGKIKGYRQEKVYGIVFVVGTITLMLNFLPYVVEFFKRI